MESRVLQWIVPVILIILTLTPLTSAQLVYIYRGDFELPIPAQPATGRAWMDDAVIDVPDHFLILDLDVAVTLTHTKAFDLQLYLQSPAGRKLCLNAYGINDYFDGEDYLQTTFDDEAYVPIEDAAPPFTGRFRPRAPALLEIFDGEDAYGQWRLQIYDAFYADTGTLETVELIVTTPEPATAAFLLLGTVALHLHARRSRHKHT